MPTTSQDSSRSRRAAHFSKEHAEAPGRQAVQSPRSAAPQGSGIRSKRLGRRPSGSQDSSRLSERTARATKRAAAARDRRAAATRKEAEKRSRAIPAVAIVAIAVAFAVAVAGMVVVPRLFNRDNAPTQEDYPSGEQVIVVIPDGAGGAQIAQTLIENHVISDDNAFYQEVQKQNADASLKSGTYQFVTGATMSEVVKQLVSGPNATDYQLKLPEGLSVAQTAAQVESQLGIPADDFIEQAKASNYVDDYPFLADVSPDYDTLEGYLFGKTYDLGGADMSADEVIRLMLDQYQAEVDALDFETARAAINERYNISISDYGIIKLASIVEREALTDEERPQVASVFYNRLGRPFPGMGYVWPYLQSDATMMYVVDGEVTQADNQSDSPYSTYTNKNLPPTPICSPSLPSIQAALDPAETDYFFFYIKKDYSAFSETAEEHEQAEADYVNGQSEE